jgi:hypothetical protein
MFAQGFLRRLYRVFGEFCPVRGKEHLGNPPTPADTWNRWPGKGDEPYMLRKTLAFAVLALAIPTVALAAKPTTHPNKGKSAPNVTYILKGTLSNFTAASTTADGSVTINVTHSNFHAHALVGQQLTFGVSMKTTTKLKGGTISGSAHGIVKFRAPLRVTNTTLMTALTATTPMSATQVIAH